MAVEVGDDAEQGGPALARAAISGPVIAGGMVAKAGTIKAGGDGASAKVAFGEGAGDRARKALKLLGGGKRVLRVDKEAKSREDQQRLREIGRASCRERVWTVV